MATLLRSDTRRFSRSVPLARQGVLALSLQMEPRWGKGWRLLLFNCHFTILGGDDARRSNITELVRSRTRRSTSVLQCALLIVFYDTGPEQEARRPALSARSATCFGPCQVTFMREFAELEFGEPGGERDTSSRCLS